MESWSWTLMLQRLFENGRQMAAGKGLTLSSQDSFFFRCPALGSNLFKTKMGTLPYMAPQAQNAFVRACLGRSHCRIAHGCPDVS